MAFTGAKEGDLSTGRSECVRAGTYRPSANYCSASLVGNQAEALETTTGSEDESPEPEILEVGENLALRESECEGRRSPHALGERPSYEDALFRQEDSKKKRPNTHSRENENKQTNGDRQGKGSNSPTPTREINKPETNTSSETGVKSDIIGTHLEELLSKLRDQVAIVDEIMKKAHKPKKELKDAWYEGKEKITTKKDEGSLQKEITELRRENKTLMSRMQALEEDMRKVVVKKEKEIETLLTENIKLQETVLELEENAADGGANPNQKEDNRPGRKAMEKHVEGLISCEGQERWEVSGSYYKHYEDKEPCDAVYVCDFEKSRAQDLPKEIRQHRAFGAAIESEKIINGKMIYAVTTDRLNGEDYEDEQSSEKITYLIGASSDLIDSVEFYSNIEKISNLHATKKRDRLRLYVHAGSEIIVRRICEYIFRQGEVTNKIEIHKMKNTQEVVGGNAKPQEEWNKVARETKKKSV
ncbi:hypothetical protein ABEB36_015826 [Hypothenemus hampei]|uniref:Uncharacterized protein n=1 Tax=Hypothenemus hampei TaxID=57062 RepID=A0ABD1DYM5_HYPHA